MRLPLYRFTYTATYKGKIFESISVSSRTTEEEMKNDIYTLCFIIRHLLPKTGFKYDDLPKYKKELKITNIKIIEYAGETAYEVG